MTIEDIALQMTPGIGIKGAVHLLELFGDARSIFAATADELVAKADLRPDTAQQIVRRKGFPAAEKELAHCRRNDIAAVASTDPEYPALLREIPDYPHVIYIKGCVEALSARCMHRSIDSFRAVRLSTNVPAPCCTFSNPMLAKIFTASRTVERPTPKIFINSDSVGNFPPTSNRPCAICSCNRTAISSANDLFRIVVSVLSIITSSDVCAKITDFSKIKKLFAYSNIVRIFTNTRSENMSPKAYTEQEEQLARFAKAMGHPARMAILRFLAGQDSCFFGDIHEVLPIAKATVSQHLKELKAAGLIQGEIEAPKVRYCINRENWAKARESFADFFCEYRKKGSCCG